MRAGDLRDRVSLQEEGTVQDDIGQPIPTWVEVTKLWSNIKYQSGVEVVKAGAPASIAKVSIQIRKRAGVTSAMRIVDAAGVVYKIGNVLPDMERRDRINLPCEVVA